MNIFSRVSDLLAAHSHSLLDRVEDPGRMLTHLMGAMEARLISAKQQAAGAIAAERGLHRELEQQRAAAMSWRERARLALACACEDLARRALAKKIEHDDLIHSLENQHAAAEQLRSEVKQAIHVWQGRLAAARRRHKLLLAGQQAARVRLEARSALEAGQGFVGGSWRRLEELEERLMDMEDRLFAQSELTGTADELAEDLERLESARRIEVELAALQGDVRQP